jgi:ArsR family transcriptional regulator
MAKKIPYDMARLFLALSSDTRLQLLGLMLDGEVCVCELVEALGQPQPKISQHLACLRSVGIVEARREGKWMHYRIAQPSHAGAVKVLASTLEWLREDKDLSLRGRKKTPRSCSSSSCSMRSNLHPHNS